jgi:hypothetical protein
VYFDGSIHDDPANLVFFHKERFNAKAQSRQDAKRKREKKGTKSHFFCVLAALRLCVVLSSFHHAFKQSLPE